MSINKKPRDIFKAHPIFGWTLSPNSVVNVPFREAIIQNINSAGHRNIPFPSYEEAKKLTIYGCSFTYGTGLSDEETFSALLQKNLPKIEIINNGIGGHSTVQNYLRFRDDIKKARVDLAIFGIISDHRYRNIAHPYRMKAYLSPDWHRIGVEHVPHIHFDRNGETYIDFTSIWQPSLNRGDFNSFLPDEYFLDLATIAILEEILLLANQNKIPIVFALLDQLDHKFNQLILNKFPEAIDVSTPYSREYSFYPDDVHPNQFANQKFADRLLAELQSLLVKKGFNE